MSPTDLVLSRLDDPREVAPGRWRARCPAHGGKNRSTLSVGVGDNECVLLTCWTGCSIEAVCAALGLDVADLFPARSAHAPSLKRRHMVSAGQALDLLDAEANVVAVAACNVATGFALSEADLARLLKAAARIHMLRGEAHA